MEYTAAEMVRLPPDAVAAPVAAGTAVEAATPVLFEPRLVVRASA
ncbi:hypothetical protein [Streptomyces sp. AB3(2024)]